MGLDMNFYRLKKGIEISEYNYKDLSRHKPYKYFRKNYTIHEIMCLTYDLVEENLPNHDISLSPTIEYNLPYPYYFGGGHYKISREQYEYIKIILQKEDLDKYVIDYNEKDNPQQLLEILKDFDKYDFWYSWCN